MAHYRMPSNQYDNWYYNMSNQFNMSNNFNQNNLTGSNQNELMDHIQNLTTETINLNFQLDIFPDDEQTIQAFNDLNDRLKTAVNEYESKYGPLSLESPFLKGTPWKWLESPWPWERQGGM
ncbi:MAG: spore coat protein CotJB [Bacilli bacterium]